MEILGEGYPRELARLLGMTLAPTQRALQSLERDGLVVGRTVGRTRLFQINPGYFATQALRQFLARLAEADGDLQSRIAGRRRRPRRTSKPL